MTERGTITHHLATLRSPETDADGAFRAVVAIARSDAPEAERIPALVAALRHARGWAQNRAAVALGDLDATPGGGAPPPLSQVAARLRAEVAVPALVACLESPDGRPLLRTNAAYALAQLRVPEARVVPVLLEPLYHGEWWLKLYAARALARMAGRARAAVPALAGALSDADPNLYRNAALALARIAPHAAEGAGIAVDALLPFLEDAERAPPAAEALARLGRPALPALTLALGSRDRHTSAMAAYALSKSEVVEGAASTRMSDTSPYRPQRDELFVRAPDVVLNHEKSAAFERLLADAAGAPHHLTYALPYPKHEFLSYVAQRRGYLLHGSTHGEIAVFEPRSQTDARGRLTSSIFATPDELWSLYFAILDRDLVVNMRNGPSWGPDASGVQRKYYHFSVDTEALVASPWRSGIVYLLPGDTFRATDGYPPERLSAVPVRPVARLPVTPADFPFRHEIWGNDWRFPPARFDLNGLPWLDAARIFPVRPQRTGP